ncbi:M50 family metallopeptidase [Garicola koreensis]|uniref:M50 family peptidase n=1 Tax=Garicola koreensis TaxID=1262554 RepID=A0A7W5TR26_9MICC|nr:M50 family metallopeptidase [Garicola koreensis]MBB3668216.1 hypothetical protein [Garicola koreensis]
MEHARTVLDFVTERFTAASQPEPTVIAAVGVVAVLMTVVPGIWRIVRQASTIIHEMGHVVAAWISGRRVSGIKLHSDTSGVTLSRGRPRGFGMLITALAGYPAPGLLALGLAALAATGYAGAGLTVYQLVIVVALLLSRNVVGIVSCLISVLATGVIWWFNDPALVTHTVVGLSIFYAVAGARGTLDLWTVHFAALRPGSGRAVRAHAKQRAASTDASRAAQAWAVPAAVWLLFFLLMSFGGAVAVFWMLFAR